jgi:RHS repeat-associated protein
LEPGPSHSAARKRAAARRFQALGIDAFIIVAGEQRDPETGLYNLRARYYDERTGRFLSTDPLGGGYPYAGNNPVRFIDPLGLYQICGDDPVWGWICFDSTQVGLGPCDVEGACYYWSEEGGVEWAIACSDNVCLFPDGSIRGPDYYLDHANNYVDTTPSPNPDRLRERERHISCLSGDILDCEMRVEVFLAGASVTAFGVGWVVMGCGVVAPIVGAATVGAGGVVTCGVAAATGSLMVVTGIIISAQSLKPWRK